MPRVRQHQRYGDDGVMARSTNAAPRYAGQDRLAGSPVNTRPYHRHLDRQRLSANVPEASDCSGDALGPRNAAAGSPGTSRSLQRHQRYQYQDGIGATVQRQVIRHWRSFQLSTTRRCDAPPATLLVQRYAPHPRDAVRLDS
jgi:hypothetical protein